MMTAVECVRAAVACLQPGRPDGECETSAFFWQKKLICAHIQMNAALFALNKDGYPPRAKAQVMRMTNWIRAEKRRAAKAWC